MCKFDFSCKRTFGVELETVSRLTDPLQSAAMAVCDAYNLPYSVITTRSAYHAHEVRLPDGRKWRCITDGSLSHGGCEIVTPPLTVADLPDLKRVMHNLNQRGHKTDTSCGAHVHVGACDLDAPALRRLLNLFFSKQDLLLQSNGTQWSRSHGGYASAIQADWLNRVNRAKPATIPGLARLWYGTEDWQGRAQFHYDDSRYQALNLHCFFATIDSPSKQTVEFRFFEGSLDYAQVEANVLLALSMVEMAAASKSASAKTAPSQDENPRYTFRCFLLRLGFIGDEFKSARKVLLNRLQGDTAWLRGKDAYESYHAQVANRRAQPTA